MVEKLVEQDSNPEGNTEATAGDDARLDRGGKDDRLPGTGADAAVAPPADDAAIGFDFDLDNG
jgi:hypothetical protein